MSTARRDHQQRATGPARQPSVSGKTGHHPGGSQNGNGRAQAGHSSGAGRAGPRPSSRQLNIKAERRRQVRHRTRRIAVLWSAAVVAAGLITAGLLASSGSGALQDPSQFGTKVLNACVVWRRAARPFAGPAGKPAPRRAACRSRRL